MLYDIEGHVIRELEQGSAANLEPKLYVGCTDSVLPLTIDIQVEELLSMPARTFPVVNREDQYTNKDVPGRALTLVSVEGFGVPVAKLALSSVAAHARLRFW